MVDETPAAAIAVHDVGMQVSVVYFVGCANWERAAHHVRLALDAIGRTDLDIGYLAVETEAEAVEAGMRGSPTILLDGQDLFADGPSDAGLTCRLYATTEGRHGAPAVRDLVEAFTGR
jgi:hypothetical protein